MTRLARAAAQRRSLPLWTRKAKVTLGTKYVAVETCYPLTATRCDIEVTDGGLYVRRDSVPIELRIFVDDVRRRFVAELLVQTDLFKFVVESVGLFQIVRIAKLTDEVRG